MTSPLRDQLDAAMAEVHEYRAKLAATRKEVAEISVEVLAKDRTCTVTMSGRGQLKDIRFHGMAYASMPPAQLSALLVETVGIAQRQLAEKSRLAFEPLAGVGTVLRTSMTGGSELDGVLGSLRDMFRVPESDEAVSDGAKARSDAEE
jgi:DNA-binding protein YbaB